MSNDKMSRDEQRAAFDAIIARKGVFELTLEEETLMDREGRARDFEAHRRIARMESAIEARNWSRR